jgi:hypothetical protein
MGFYDHRCMVSGVSLKGADAALVPLQQTESAYVPITLAIKGNYNRLGAIDGITEDTNTDLVLRCFSRKLQTGELIVDQKYLRIHGYFPFRTIENLVQACERNLTDNPHAVLLNGRPVVYALISQAIWEEIARAAPASAEPAEARFHRLFTGSPVAEEIYASNLDGATQHLHELAAVHDYLAARGIAWHPPDDPSQHDSEEMQEYLDEARRAFRDCPIVSQGLQRYEREVGDLLEED